jgi:hypothetical protein
MTCEISSKNHHRQYNEDSIYKKQGEIGRVEGVRDKAIIPCIIDKKEIQDCLILSASICKYGDVF